MSAQILQFPLREPQLVKLADNLWVMRLDDSPESAAQADRIIEALRANNLIVPKHMKGPDDAA